MPTPRPLDTGAYPAVERMQRRAGATEKQTPGASRETEEQVDLRAPCFPGNAPRHEVLAVVENRVIQILPEARACPLHGFFPRVPPRLVLPGPVGMVGQKVLQARDFDRSGLQPARQTVIVDDLPVADVNTVVRDQPSCRNHVITDAQRRCRVVHEGRHVEDVADGGVAAGAPCSPTGSSAPRARGLPSVFSLAGFAPPGK